jgi:putative N-acetyltransferase (TIGR04045 family)
MPATGLVSPFSEPIEAERHLQQELKVTCRTVQSPAERDLHHQIRHEVFVREQRLFSRTDRDEHDLHRATLHVLGQYGPVVAGTVRLYPLEEGLWRGDRLAVLPAFRSHRIGPPLVHFAVAAAAVRGGTAMIASIQPQNVRLFEMLGWRCVGEPTLYVGRLHQKMMIDLHADAAT